MLFHSFEYLLLLWGSFVLGWAFAKRKSIRHTLLMLGSMWFYAQAGFAAGHWWFILLLVFSIFLDYYAAHGIARAAERGSAAGKRFWMGVSLTGNLGLLGFFKYWDFILEDGIAHLGVHVDPWLIEIAIPAGISFYTFQTLSYTLDVYLGKLKPIDSLLDFSLFVSFFPQLIAGPIVRAADFLPQMAAEPAFHQDKLSSGIFQFLRGATKKLLMADILGQHLVDPAFRDLETVQHLGAPALLLAMYAYALQLYGDFAGYSDMAIGSARILGFELRPNFNAPFKSRSLEDFWSRWHISMSSWFMDYVYKQLGGSRVSLGRAAWNVFFVWTLVGLWHGASWTFVLWGMYHGAWLIASRVVRTRLPGGAFPDRPATAIAGGLFAFHVVALSMIIFRCRDLAMLRAAFAQFASWTPHLTPAIDGVHPAVPWQIWTILVLGYFTHLWPERWVDLLERGFMRLPALAQGAVIAVAIVFFFGVHPPGLAPFIYFSF
jgi:D-alanyl-lipoteichoic acid acyltransferase DltB (MBOAT superfamily)